MTKPDSNATADSRPSSPTRETASLAGEAALAADLESRKLLWTVTHFPARNLAGTGGPSEQPKLPALVRWPTERGFGFVALRAFVIDGAVAAHCASTEP